MVANIWEQRAFPRVRMHCPIEYKALTRNRSIIHEGSKLEDYSQAGACFLAMADVEVGMRVIVNIIHPERNNPISLHAEVVRVDERSDPARMFKVVGIRWVSGARIMG